MFLVVTLTADGLQLLVTWLSVRLAWEVGNQLRSDLARKATSLELAWHGNHSPGLLIERIDGDIEAINKFSSTAVLQLLGNAVLLVGVLTVACVVDWRAGLLIGTAAVVAGGLLVKLRAVGIPAHDHEREVLSRLYGDLEERLGGLEDLRANGAGRYARPPPARALVALVARGPPGRAAGRQLVRGGRRRLRHRLGRAPSASASGCCARASSPPARCSCCSASPR